MSAALLFSLVVTEEKCFENFLRSLYMKQYVFLFKCRVTFRLRYLPPNATFGTLALYILRLRCFGISNTYKNSFCLLSKTETFQNDVEYVSKMSIWALVGLILWLYIEKLFWELAEISLHETISVFWSNAESRFGCAICLRTRRSVLWLFTSCVWDVVGYRLVKKTVFVSWAKQKLSKTTLSKF